MIKALLKIKRKVNKNKPKLYLHIGMGKTGTTALQEFFWDNRKILSDYGVSYPEYCVVSSAHHRLSPHVPEFLKNTWKFEPVNDWAPKLRTMGASKMLLSSELIAWAKPEIIHEFCEELKRWFDVYVVLYLRRQDNLVMAGYNQQIKAGTQKKGIGSVLETQINRFNYENMMAPWVENLGKEKLIVRPYERQQFYNGDIRLDFLYHVFGISAYDNFNIENKNSNPRLSYAAMEYKRRINGLFDDVKVSSRFNEVLLEYSARTDDSSTSIYTSSSILSPSDRLCILDKYKDMNCRIAKDYLGREDGVLFYDKIPEITESWVAPKLTKNDFEKINNYIKDNHPRVYELLDSRVSVDNRRKIIVHFGTHKTGSSSIQNVLHRLDKKSFDYLCFDQPNSSLLLANGFLKPENLYKKRKDGIERYSKIRILARKRLEGILSDAKGVLGIISAEVISSFDYDELVDFIDFLKPWYEEVRFVGYVREPVSFSVSVFQEALKRKCVSLKTFRPRYDKFVNNLDSILGSGNVDVYLFDKDSFPEGGVVVHFLQSIGISEDISSSSLDNVSLSLPAVKFLYAYRCLSKETEMDIGHPKSLQTFLDILSCLKGYRFDVNRQLSDEIRRNNLHLFAWLRDRLSFSGSLESRGADYGISSEQDLLSISYDEIDQLYQISENYDVDVSDLMCDLDGVVECVRRLRRRAVELHESTSLINS